MAQGPILLALKMREAEQCLLGNHQDFAPITRLLRMRDDGRDGGIAVVAVNERQRPELEAALDWVRSGDTFIVTKPDRLARNVVELLSIVERLKAKGVTVRILSMHLDTGNPTSNLILTILAGVGSWEREVMLERQRAGIAKAKSEGKYRGRAPTARAKAPEVLQLKAEGKTVAEIAKTVGISRASIYRALNEAA